MRTQGGGIPGVDETVFLESSKEKKRGMTRMPRKRGGKAEKCSLSDEQIPGLICRGHTANTAVFLLGQADKGLSRRCSNRSLRAMLILNG